MKNQLGMLIGIAIVFLVSVKRTEAKKVCYKDLGCFSNTQPRYIFLIPHFTLPASPKEIGTKFLLFTRENPEIPKVMKPQSPESIANSFFDGKKSTVFITHGYLSSGNESWIQEMTKALLDVEDQNVIVVDWSSGAFHKYTRSIANSRVVGAQIAFFIKQLEKYGESSRSRTHIIGHSLGAHVAGFAGKKLPSLSKITGLDPAGPGFESCLNKMRLHHTDASFVVVIHTNAAEKFGLSLGLRRNLGDVDFYPNGGITQPRCDHDFICSHLVACLMFIESIHNYPVALEGKPCASLEDYEAGLCEDCKEGCNPIGLFTTKPAKRTTYYLNTKRDHPNFKEAVEQTNRYMMENVYSYFDWSSDNSKDEAEETEESLISQSINQVYSWWNDEDDDEDNFPLYLTDFIRFWSNGSNEKKHQETTIPETVEIPPTATAIVAEQKEGERIFGPPHSSSNQEAEESLISQSINQVYSWWNDEDDDEDNFPLYLTDFIRFWSNDSNEQKHQETTTPETVEIPSTAAAIVAEKKESGSIFGALWSWLIGPKEDKAESNFESTTSLVDTTSKPTTAATMEATTQISNEQEEEKSFYLNVMEWIYSSGKTQKKGKKETKNSKGKSKANEVAATTKTPAATTSADTTEKNYWDYLAGIFG